MHMFCFLHRYVGFSRPGPDATEVPVRADGSRVGERSTEAQVEVAADPAEQRGLLLQRLHISLRHFCDDCMKPGEACFTRFTKGEKYTGTMEKRKPFPDLCWKSFNMHLKNA